MKGEVGYYNWLGLKGLVIDISESNSVTFVKHFLHCCFEDISLLLLRLKMYRIALTQFLYNFAEIIVKTSLQVIFLCWWN